MDLALAGGLVAAGALGHAVVALLRARPPGHAVPGREEYLQRWRSLHGGYDPGGNPLVRAWLSSVHAAAGPLARRGVAPGAVTWFALWPLAAVLLSAQAGGRWPALGALLVLLSGLLDALDGAVAVLSSRHSRWGYLLDSLVDRVSDLGYVAAVVLLGAPLWLGAAVGGGLLLHEYARARGSSAGAGDIGAVTVGERPSRVIACGLALAAGGALPDRAPEAATLSLGVLGGLTAVGAVQLVVALRRALAGPTGGAAG